LTRVLAGGVTLVVIGDAGSELPKCKDIVPPLLLVRVASGPFKIETIVPAVVSISKIAGPYCMPKFKGTTVPVTVRTPAVDISTVPPLLPCVKAPKFIFCKVYTDTFCANECIEIAVSTNVNSNVIILHDVIIVEFLSSQDIY
jgi:hypothetical protein